MRYTRRIVRRALAQCGAAAIAIIIAGGATALAQRYQATFGGSSNPGETGESVIQCVNGDHVTAGVDYSVNGGTTPNLYIVRTDALGNLLWNFVYKIGQTGACYGRDIKECSNGNLVVVGWSDNPGACSGCRDGFVMRIQSTGTPIWCRSIVGPYGFAELHSVVVATLGSGAFGAGPLPNDILVGGTIRNGQPSTLDGYLARIDSNGNNIIWEKSYGLLSQNSIPNDDVINDIDESQLSTPGNPVGDIVATGSSTDIGNGTPPDIWVFRVNGNNGFMTAIAHQSAVYGTAAADVGLSIRELRFGSNPGALAIVGYSDGAPSPSTSREAFVVESQAKVCSTLIASTFLGDNGPMVDVGYAVREITNSVGGIPGDLMVAGGTFNSVFGGEDAFLQGFQEGTLGTTTAFTVYGDAGDDEARSLYEARNAPNSLGWVFTGVTTSTALMPPGNQQNVYQVKANTSLNSLCNFATGSAVCSTWVVTPVPSPPMLAPQTLFQNTSVTFAPVTTTWTTPVCQRRSEAGPNSDNGNDGIASVDLVENESIFTSYPNPVAHDGSFNLRYVLSRGGKIDVEIADMSGRVVYQHAEARDAGMTNELVSTAGWPAGAYVVKMTAGAAVRTTRIMVSAK